MISKKCIELNLRLEEDGSFDLSDLYNLLEASRFSKESELNEFLDKDGRFVPGVLMRSFPYKDKEENMAKVLVYNEKYKELFSYFSNN